MEEKEKGRISVRLDDEDVIAIEALIADGEYENMSVFIRQATKEKLNPKLRKAREKKAFMDMLEDPAVLRKLAEGLLTGADFEALQRKAKQF